jgi:hypothetical protein
MKGSELAVKSVYVRYCRTCNDKLVPDLNWRSSEVKTGDYLCKYCARKYDNEQKIKFHKKHPEYKKKEYLLHRVGYIARAAKRYKKNKISILQYRKEYYKQNLDYCLSVIRFKDKCIRLQQNPRIGVCNWCRGVVPFDCKRTAMHHEQYDENNPLAHTIELCVKCTVIPRTITQDEMCYDICCFRSNSRILPVKAITRSDSCAIA